MMEVKLVFGSGSCTTTCQKDKLLYRYVPCTTLEYYIHMWILYLTRLRKKWLQSWFSVFSISPTQDHSTSSTKNSPKTASAFAVDPFWNNTLSPWGDLSGRIGWIEVNSLHYQSYLLGLSPKGSVLLRDFFCGMAGIMQLGHPKMNIVKAFSCWFCWLFRGKYLWQLAIWRVRAGTKGNTVHFVWQSELAITWPKNTHLTTIVSLFNFEGI